MSDLFFDRINTAKGTFSVLFSENAIYELYFPGSSPEGDYRLRSLPWPKLAEDLNLYMGGEKVNWNQYLLDCSGYKPFTAKLLKEVSRIPYGQVCSYREAAVRAGSPLAWRAAGQALSINRHPIIVPCHRVVGSNGKLGGFSGPPGWKEMLLKIEGALKE